MVRTIYDVLHKLLLNVVYSSCDVFCCIDHILKQPKKFLVCQVCFSVHPSVSHVYLAVHWSICQSVEEIQSDLKSFYLNWLTSTMKKSYWRDCLSVIVSSWQLSITAGPSAESKRCVLSPQDPHYTGWSWFITDTLAPYCYTLHIGSHYLDQTVLCGLLLNTFFRSQDKRDTLTHISTVKGNYCFGHHKLSQSLNGSHNLRNSIWIKNGSHIFI